MQYGADYNPDQWPRETWAEDVRLMREAGVTIVSLGIFSWSRIQPAEDSWDFAWLDEIIDLLHAAGIRVNLATATASPPPWVAVRYPQTLPEDASGARYWPGSRQQFAPSSPVYRRLAAALVTRLAERYAEHPAVAMWHVGNEFGCHLPMDFSDAARDAFRAWLENRYATIATLNDAWGTSFWSQRYASFAEIFPPRLAPYSHNPSAMLDFRRFTNDMWLECYLDERRILLEAGASQPITTNFMGPFKPADYEKWAPHVDVVADDCYPDPASPTRVRDSAFQRDLMRSLKPGVPWILMEQATDAVNWRSANPGKSAATLMAETAQSIGRGADGIMFFQWRQSRMGSEKFHSAMLPHAGTSSATWRAAVALGERLAGLEQLPPPGDDAQVAIVFDWENWWAVEGDDHPARVDYLRLCQQWYGELHSRGILVDIVPPERVDGRYRLALAPALYLMRSAGAGCLDAFVRDGGVLLAGPFTDVVDENDRFLPAGFLTRLGPALGLRLEDFGALADGATTGGAGVGATASRTAAEPERARFRFGDIDATGDTFAELVVPEGADVHAEFTSGRMRGRPALTRHAYGRGVGWYVTTVPDRAGIAAIVDALVDDAAVGPLVPTVPDGVEIAQRGPLLTIINHGERAATVDLAGVDLESGDVVTSVPLAPQQVVFLRVERDIETAVHRADDLLSAER